MTTKYIAGKGATLKVTIASTATALGQMTKITPPKMERGEIDTTHLLSVWKEFIAAIAEGGEVEFTVEWNPEDTGHAYLWTSFQAGTTEVWLITLSDGTTIGFSGFIKSFPWDELSNETVSTIKFTLRISGAVTITPA